MSADDVAAPVDDAAEGVPARLAAMLEALGDGTCRAILQTLGEAGRPLTARDLTRDCTASQTSVYRKLDQLTEAGLVEERDELDPDGHRRSRYLPAAGQIEILLGAARGVEVTLLRPASSGRLAAL